MSAHRIHRPLLPSRIRLRLPGVPGCMGLMGSTIHLPDEGSHRVHELPLRPRRLAPGMAFQDAGISRHVVTSPGLGPHQPQQPSGQKLRCPGALRSSLDCSQFRTVSRRIRGEHRRLRTLHDCVHGSKQCPSDVDVLHWSNPDVAKQVRVASQHGAVPHDMRPHRPFPCLLPELAAASPKQVDRRSDRFDQSEQLMEAGRLPISHHTQIPVAPGSCDTPDARPEEDHCIDTGTGRCVPCRSLDDCPRQHHVRASPWWVVKGLCFEAPVMSNCEQAAVGEGAAWPRSTAPRRSYNARPLAARTTPLRRQRESPIREWQRARHDLEPAGRPLRAHDAANRCLGLAAAVRAQPWPPPRYSSCTSGSDSISAGVPSLRIRPLCIIVTLSATRSATSMSCSMMM